MKYDWERSEGRASIRIFLPIGLLTIGILASQFSTHQILNLDLYYVRLYV